MEISYDRGRLGAHFGLVGDQGLRGLFVVVSELPVIDLHELVRLNISWAWVALGPERQQAAAAGALGAAKDAPAADEDVQRIDRLEKELMDASGRTYHAFDSTLVGSLRLSYERRVRPRTGEASTSTAP
ncbi:hypothetical protein Tco_0276155 [Tanacetum coccineum]